MANANRTLTNTSPKPCLRLNTIMEEQSGQWPVFIPLPSDPDDLEAWDSDSDSDSESSGSISALDSPDCSKLRILGISLSLHSFIDADFPEQRGMDSSRKVRRASATIVRRNQPRTCRTRANRPLKSQWHPSHTEVWLIILTRTPSMDLTQGLHSLSRTRNSTSVHGSLLIAALVKMARALATSENQ